MADPQQAGQALINLINQGPEHAAHPHADFIDADGLDAPQDPMLEAILDHPLDRGIHIGPGHLKASAVSSQESLRAQRASSSRKPSQRGCLPVAHGTFSTSTPQVWAIDPAHGVDQQPAQI